MTVVAPNPYSPFADADPAFRHLIPVPFLFPDPTPGALTLTGCDRLAVAPEQTTETAPGAELPDGLCAACVAVMRAGEPQADTRASAPCRECGSSTLHDGLCALCRMELHDAWWPTRDAVDARESAGYETGADPQPKIGDHGTCSAPVGRGAEGTGTCGYEIVLREERTALMADGTDGHGKPGGQLVLVWRHVDPAIDHHHRAQLGGPA